GPRVGRVAGQRHPGGQGAVNQRDEGLPGGDDQPGPDGPWPGRRDREAVRGEDAGSDRDERERHRERLEVAERPDELLLVPETGQQGIVILLGNGGHLCISSSGAGTVGPPRRAWSVVTRRRSAAGLRSRPAAA